LHQFVFRVSGKFGILDKPISSAGLGQAITRIQGHEIVGLIDEFSATENILNAIANQGVDFFVEQRPGRY
jgi:hypothetical protein